MFDEETYNKLKYKMIRPCRTLKKVTNTSYKLELPESLNISFTLKVANLYEYHTGTSSEDGGEIL